MERVPSGRDSRSDRSVIARIYTARTGWAHSRAANQLGAAPGAGLVTDPRPDHDRVCPVSEPLKIDALLGARRHVHSGRSRPRDGPESHDTRVGSREHGPLRSRWTLTVHRRRHRTPRCAACGQGPSEGRQMNTYRAWPIRPAARTPRRPRGRDVWVAKNPSQIPRFASSNPCAGRWRHGRLSTTTT